MRTAYTGENRDSKSLISVDEAIKRSYPRGTIFYCADPNCPAKLFLRRGKTPSFVTMPSSMHKKCVAYDGYSKCNEKEINSVKEGDIYEYLAEFSASPYNGPPSHKGYIPPYLLRPKRRNITLRTLYCYASEHSIYDYNLMQGYPEGCKLLCYVGVIHSTRKQLYIPQSKYDASPNA